MVAKHEGTESTEQQNRNSSQTSPQTMTATTYEPWHEISNNVVCATSVRAVWSKPLLVAWIFYDCKATDWTLFGVSKLNRRLRMLVWVYTCQNATLLEISCHGSNHEYTLTETSLIIELLHDVSNNMVYASSKVPDQPEHMCSLIWAIVSRLNVLRMLSYRPNNILISIS